MNAMFGLLDASWIFYAAIGGVALIGADALYLTVHHATDHRRRVNRRLARLDGVAGREQASIQLKRERGLDASGAHVMSLAWINTLVAGAAAGLAWSLTEKVRDGHFTNLGVASGIVAGLVIITPAAGFVTTGSAILMGLIGGPICALAVGLKTKLGYDDALDVIGVHFIGGLVGSILLGFFADSAGLFNEGGFSDGVFFGGGTHLLVEQIVANVVTIVYSFIVTFAIAKVLDKTIGLRVDEDVEIEGLDIREHAETAYSTL